MVRTITAPADKVGALLDGDGRSPEERRQLARLVALLAGLPPLHDPGGHFPEVDRLHAGLLSQLTGDDGEALEESLLELYCHLHMHEAPYTPAERQVVRSTGGYWCHAGGLSPLLRAGPWLGPTTVSADLGAGNGLQGLLLQRLYPHRRTILVEISSGMVERGRALQTWLGVPDDRVEWVLGDVRDFSVVGVDFLYLYRPLRPEGSGRDFYRRLAAELGRAASPVVVFSVADCLGPFLGSRFERFAFDGQLACFRGPLPDPVPVAVPGESPPPERGCPPGRGRRTRRLPARRGGSQ